MNKQSAIAKKSEEGFTIVELMIATTILSVILILVTAVIISIGSLFYKGFNQANTQDNTRNILDQVSKDIQLTGNTTLQSCASPGCLKAINLTATYSYPADTLGNPFVIDAYCIGTTRYSYVVNLEQGSNGKNATQPEIAHVFWRDSIDTTQPCTPLNLTQTNPESPSSNPGTSGSGSELIAPASRLTGFAITTVYGGYDISVGVAYNDARLSPLPGNQCTGLSGDQYCATDSLNTYVVQRL